MLSVIRVARRDEAFAVNNDVKYGLSSSVYTRDVNVAFRALNELDNGITYVNAPTIGAEAHLPFGGVKQTGNGHREGGWEVYEFYSETKVGLRATSRARCSGRRSTTTTCDAAHGRIVAGSRARRLIPTASTWPRRRAWPHDGNCTRYDRARITVAGYAGTASDHARAAGRERCGSSTGGSPLAFFWEWAKIFQIAVLLFLVIRTFLVEAFKIPSGSMERTLLVGDFLLVNKLVYGAEVPFTDQRLPRIRTPQRGRRDRVRVAADLTKNFVKRLVGLPGDTLAMRDGVLFRNGAARRRDATSSTPTGA